MRLRIRVFQITGSNAGSTVFIRKKLDADYAKTFLPGSEKKVSDFMKKKFKHGNDFEHVAAAKYATFIVGLVMLFVSRNVV